MEEAERVVGEIAVIDHGKIIAQGSAEALKGKTSLSPGAAFALTRRPPSIACA